MTQQEFSAQMDRLIDVFGEKAYGTERAKLIWETVKVFDVVWWHKCVDHFIGYFKVAPLMVEISEAAAQERERLWTIEKRRNADASVDFWNGSFHPEESKQICETIKGRIQGRVGDAEYEKFLKMLSKIKHIPGGAA